MIQGQNGGTSLLWAFLAKPRTVAAIHPSSQDLVNAVLSPIEGDSNEAILEVGVGTGALTRGILERYGQQCTYLGLEIEETLRNATKSRFPYLNIVLESAANLETILDREGFLPTCIVASLPWTLFSPIERMWILRSIANALPEGGRFLTYTYVTASLLRRSTLQFRSSLEKLFTTVDSSSIIWRNIPPAFAIACAK